MSCLTISGESLWLWRHQQLRALQTDHGSPAQEEHPREILRAELDWLLREVTQLDRLTLRLGLFRSSREISSSRSLSEIDILWQKRLQDQVPIQYLLGQVTWRHFTLEVSPAVLIPRPETELIVDLAVEATQRFPDLAQGIWVDLGTGSGAIALGLVDALSQVQCFAVDVSGEALALATRNAQTLGLGHRIRFRQGSWFEPLTAFKGAFSGIVSNPPYIPTAIVPTLQTEVVKHEPHLALDGGEDGLRDIRDLAAQAYQYLKPGGFLVLECMAGQGEAIQDLLRQDGHYRGVSIGHDLAGLDRFVQAFRC